VHFLQPTTWAEALEAMAALPRGLPVAGGTDVMVELNFHRRHPEALIDLGRIQGLGEMSRGDGWLRVGAAATYDQLTVALRVDFPALALAARTVGSPQIRHRGTIGGNLGTASPGGTEHVRPPWFVPQGS
jgi:CO/xanthine dehydrogenase FAD-binding subunit